MTTTENNKKFAKFLNKPLYRYEGLTKIETKLLYHKDWNWLMEVVEKIESLGNWVEILGGYHNQCNIGVQNNTKNLIERDSETKIEAVYNACVEFIDWYNKNAVKEN